MVLVYENASRRDKFTLMGNFRYKIGNEKKGLLKYLKGLYLSPRLEITTKLFD